MGQQPLCNELYHYTDQLAKSLENEKAEAWKNVLRRQQEAKKGVGENEELEEARECRRKHEISAFREQQTNVEQPNNRKAETFEVDLAKSRIEVRWDRVTHNQAIFDFERRLAAQEVENDAQDAVREAVEVVGGVRELEEKLRKATKMQLQAAIKEVDDEAKKQAGESGR
ncbi:hypothetical protein BDQ17DRAFT_1433266 [Cyathus striatus]|nr:hypothetical protein BDQ17DRAFT_1433266 [Cyathus striatus]